MKRHIENVHLKVKRKLNKSSSSNCSLANNSDSNPNNFSPDLSTNHANQATSGNTTSGVSTSINNTIAQVISSVNESKMEPSLAADKQVSCITNKNIIHQQPLNLNNNAPLTLVATSNGIGGITLTTLGSIHQSHLGNSQNNSITPLNLASINNGNTTFLTLNSTPLIIQPNQPQLIYQPSAIQVIPTNSQQQQETNNSQDINNSGMMIKNSNINLNCLNSIQSHNIVDTNGLNATVSINNSSSIVGINSNFDQNGPDLVNAILIKSEQQENSLVQDCHGLISFSDLENNHNETEQIRASFEPDESNNDVKMLIKDECEENSQHGEDEKDGKSKIFY